MAQALAADQDRMPASEVLRFLASCGAPYSAELVARSATDAAEWSPTTWRRFVEEERTYLLALPSLPSRMQRRLGADLSGFVLESDVRRAAPSTETALEHLAFVSLLVRALLVGDVAPSLGGRRIYLDNNATTPVDPRIADVVCQSMLANYGNAHSADHVFGDAAQGAIDAARRHVAGLVECDPAEVFFTSGATESIRLGLEHAIATVRRTRGRPAAVATLPVEHRAVLSVLDDARERGDALVGTIDVDRQGRIDTRSAARLISSADIVCVMCANNEIGNVYPIEQLAKLATENGAIFFSDVTQAAGKVPVRCRTWDIDVATLSGHKIYGPKGAGAIVVRGPLAETFPDPAGTPATPAIVGLGAAARLRLEEMGADETRIASLRDWLERRLVGANLGIIVNGDRRSRLAGTLHVSVPVESDVMLTVLHDRVALSTGAACATGRGSRSHVLAAMGMPQRLADGAVRIGIGKFNTPSDVQEGADALVRAVGELRR